MQTNATPLTPEQTIGRADHIKQFARAGLHVMENVELFDAPAGPKGDAIFILQSLLQAIDEAAEQVQAALSAGNANTTEQRATMAH